MHVGEKYILSYEWSPHAGLYNVTAYSPPLPSKEFTSNNIATVELAAGYSTSIFVADDNWPMPPDYDLDYYMFNTDPKHPIEWMHSIEPPQVLTAKLQIYAWDVDEPYEVDEVYFNGHYVGRLWGGDFVWTLNEFTIPASIIRHGTNVVEVYVDKDYVGWYATTIDWANLTIVYVPPEHDIAVTIGAPQYTRVEDSVVLNVTVYNNGLNDEAEIELQLIINGTVHATQHIERLESGGFLKTNFS